MKWEMEVVSPAPHVQGTNNWAAEEESSNKSTKWTPAENKMFENALAVYDKDTPDRWLKIADMIPGKTDNDVRRQYEKLEVDVSKIEAGLIPIPGYNSTSPFTLDWVSSHHSYDGFKQSYGFGGKRSSSSRPLDQERKKGVPWTEEEHKLFLMGLKKYGKGDWRNISRNFVVTRTPTQVASHAQKYFIRQLSGGKDKRRASIHDITTANINDPRTPSPDDKKPSSPDHSQVMLQSNSGSTPRAQFQWNQGTNGSNLGFNSSTNGSTFMSPNSFGISSYGMKIQGQNLHNYIGPPQSLGFQMNSSSQHYPHA